MPASGTPPRISQNIYGRKELYPQRIQLLLRESYEVHIQETVTKLADWLECYKGTFAMTWSPDWQTHQPEVAPRRRRGGSSSPYGVPLTALVQTKNRVPGFFNLYILFPGGTDIIAIMTTESRVKWLNWRGAAEFFPFPFPFFPLNTYGQRAVNTADTTVD